MKVSKYIGVVRSFTFKTYESIAATIIYSVGLLEVATYTETSSFLGGFGRISFLYAAFLYLNNICVPKLLKKEEWLKQVVIIVFAIFLTAQIFPRTDDYMVIILSFLFYTLAKFAVSKLNKFNKKIRIGLIQFPPYFLVISTLWAGFIFILLAGEAEHGFTLFSIIAGLQFMGFYLFSFLSLLPKLSSRKKTFIPYVLGSAATFGLITFFNYAFVDKLTGSDNIAGDVAMANYLIQIIITIPFSYLVYRKNAATKTEYTNLKKKAGHSEANLDLLKSQINPHFLFNVLNSLYGTAIQEKADRTAEGVQKLGDMMRFMLHENVKEHIELERELEYVTNYIDLQKLRIAPSANFELNVCVEPYEGNKKIAPMMLIPFIENAFKHGVSQREFSYITVLLKSDKRRLTLHVENSVHQKNFTDTEQNKSGIGLNNVKQRLDLFYPKNHSLKIENESTHFAVDLELEIR
jgi:hypothetical protein